MRTYTLKRTGGVAATLLMLLVGCKQSTDEVTPTGHGCQLQSEVNNGQTTIHTYNGNGQRIRSVATSANSTITYTYAYDATGNVASFITQGTIFPNLRLDVTATYEYTGGRLTKIASKSTGYLPSTTDTYTYNDAGRIATYTSASSDPQYGTESYAFTNGVLTGGAINRGGQSLTVTAENGRVATVTYPDGRKNRHAYDANGYATRSDYLDRTGALQSYTVREYSTTPYKKADSPLGVVPTINVYGNAELPESRVAIYDADGTLKAETRYQYQLNGKGYVTTISYAQNQPGVGNGQSTGSVVYTYSNCQ